MKALIQRVSAARVEVAGEVVGAIDQGLLALVGIEPQDDAEDFADRVPPGPDDAAEAEHVGGPYALTRFHRPALG